MMTESISLITYSEVRRKEVHVNTYNSLVKHRNNKFK